jgi:NAD(P)-dependent dehydrogenase (short-subunit alcohol dehydrogenase family)
MAPHEKVALITGAGSGMGRLAARNLAEAGALVAALDVNEVGLGETAAGRDGIRTWAVDVSDRHGLEAVVREVDAELGPIGRVYNAAGIMRLGKLLDQDADVIHRVMAINYGGLVNVAKLTLPGMLERGQGDFVSFSSMGGWLPTLLTGAYSASKFAVVALTETLYHENRDRGVRFACVCPPLVATPMIDPAQQTAWPRLLDGQPRIDAQEVLTAIDKALAAGRFWVFPGKGTSIGWRMRRWAPGRVWKRVHDTEGW